MWDRSEVEGAIDSRERKEREKHDRLYELKQVERERESQKVYQPPGGSRASTEKAAAAAAAAGKKAASPQQMHERATFKTHMAQRMTERKISSSTQLTQSTDKPDDTDVEWSGQTPVPAPQPVLPPSARLPPAACLTYNRVPFKLRVRKEVFHPSESIGTPATMDLLFAQVVGDVLNATPCLRVTPHDKRNAINLLGGHGVTGDAVKGQQVRAIVKRHLIDMARGWPLYFARLFTVSSSPQFPDVSLLVGVRRPLLAPHFRIVFRIFCLDFCMPSIFHSLMLAPFVPRSHLQGVSHSGVYLARRETDYLAIVRAVPLAELQGAITLPRPAALQLNLKNGNRVVLHAPRAAAIQTMVQAFCQEFKKVGTVLMRH